MKNGTNCFRAMFSALLLIMTLQSALGSELGVLGGPTYSRFSSSDLSWKYRFSYSAGVYADFRLSRFFHLQPELRFSTVRSGAVIPISYFSKSRDVNIDKIIQYVELPVILRVFPFNGEKIRPNLQLGGYAALMIHGEDRLESKGQSHAEDIHDELKKFQAGFLAGVGIDIRFAGIPIHLSGLWRITPIPLGANYLGQDIKSTGYQINLGFGIWNPGGGDR